MSNSTIAIENINVTLTALITVLNQAQFRKFEIIIIMFIGATLTLLIVNMILTKKYSNQLTKNNQNEIFDRQILKPPIRQSTTNDFRSYSAENQMPLPDVNEPMRFPEPRHINLTDQIDVNRREQEQFETFPIYYIDGMQNNRAEPPLKPLADMMNQRLQAYQNEFSDKRANSIHNEHKRNSFQKKSVSSVRNELKGEEQEHSYEFKSKEIVNEFNSTNVNRNGQFVVKKEKSFDNLTVISEIRRSKSSDFGSSSRKIDFL